jgi:hypothetical protein
MTTTRFDFQPAPSGSTGVERIAVALEFIARMVGAQAAIMVTQSGRRP